MSRSKIVIQVGFSRDGLRSYVDPVKNKGLQFIAIDNELGKPSYLKGNKLGERDFDRVIFLEDLNEDSLYEAIKELVSSEKFELLVAGFELYTGMVSKVSERLGLRVNNSSKTIDTFRFKDLQRKALLQDKRIAQPLFKIIKSEDYLNNKKIEEAIRTIGFPLVIKPADAGGSQGVSLVRNEEQLLNAIKANQNLILDNGYRSNQIFLLEQYIEGEEIGIQGVVDYKGEVYLLGMTKKIIDSGGNNNRFMEKSHLLCPASEIPTEVKDLAFNVISCLSLKSSPFHMDIRITKNGKPFLIETGARLSGAYIPKLLKTATNIDWGEVALDAQLGNKISLSKGRSFYSGLEFITSKTDLFVNRKILKTKSESLLPEEGINIVDFSEEENFSRSGDYQHISDRLGFIQVTAKSELRVRQIFSLLEPEPLLLPLMI